MAGVDDDFNDVEFLGAGSKTFLVNASTTNFTITSGTVTAPSGLLTISGNYSNSGIFAHNLGTTTLNGASQQTLSGTMIDSSAFNNLEITNSFGGGDATNTPSVIFSNTASTTATFTAITADTTVRLGANTQYTFTNINWNGQNASTPFKPRSSSSGTQWNLVVTGSQSVSNVDFMDTSACGGNNISAADGTNIDSGNNNCVNFTSSATISSASNQTFEVGQATTSVSQITITDIGSAITADDNLRIAIATSSVDMRWDTTDTAAQFGDTASSTKVTSSSVSYEGGGSVLVIPVANDFNGETLTVEGVSFTSFNSATSSTLGLQLYLDGASDIIADATDNRTITIYGTLAVADHTLGQVSNQWSSEYTSTTTVHYGFKFTPVGEGMTLATTTFNLSSITGVLTGDITSSRLYEDTDSNGKVSGGDSQVGGSWDGAVSISGSGGTIMFATSTSYTVSAATDYVLQLTASNLAESDIMTIDFYNATTTGATSTQSITITGNPSSVTHSVAVVPSITISGILYSNEGGSQITTGGKVINVAVGTSTPGVFSTTTDSGSGVWQIENIPQSEMAVGIPISIWVDADATTRASTITKASSTSNNITGVDLYQNRIIAKHEGTSGTSTTIADFAIYDANDNPNIQFKANGTLEVSTGQELHIWTEDTFAPGGAVIVHGDNAASPDGNIHIDDNATFTAGGDITLAGNWDADTDSAFTQGANTVNFNATTTGKTITGALTGSNAFANVTFNGSGGAWSFSNNASTTNFTITSGTVTAPSGLLTISGNYSNSGTFTHNSGTTTLNGSVQQTLSGTMTSPSAFNNLEIINNFGTDAQDDPGIVFGSAVSASSTLTALTADTKLKFPASATSTLTNINFNGQAAGSRVTLRSSIETTQWGIDVSGSRSVLNTDIRDSNACSGNPNIDASDSSNYDSDGNTCWDFPDEDEPEPEPEPAAGGGIMGGSLEGMMTQAPSVEVYLPEEQIKQIKEQLMQKGSELERLQQELEKKLRLAEEVVAPPQPVEPEPAPSPPPPPPPPAPQIPPAPSEEVIFPAPEIRQPSPAPVPVTAPKKPIIKPLVEALNSAFNTVKDNIKQAIDYSVETSKKIGKAFSVGFQAFKKIAVNTFRFISRILTEPVTEREKEIPPVAIPIETFVLRSGELTLIAEKDVPIQTIVGYRFTAEIKTEKPADKITDTFSFSDPDGDGIWAAEVQMPPLPGQFALSARVAYVDGEIKELKATTLIDPEGYIYEQTSRGELRVANATVTLWHKDSGEWVMWSAEKYNQQNPQITDRTGQYSFLAPKGEYYFEITADKYESFMSSSFVLDKTSPIHQNVELQYLGEAL